MTSNDSTQELLEPVAGVAERLTGQRPSPATLWRWLRKGCRGAKLNAVMHSGRWLCTEADFRQFIEDQTAAALGESAGSDEDLSERLLDEGLL